jgi:Domain of unknown function (DUF4129)
VRSRTSHRQRLTLGAAALTAVLSLAASTSTDATSADTSQPTEAEISRALDTVKADPNLATLRTIKMLRWKDSGARKPARIPAWVTWLAELFRWFDQTARVLVWGLAAVLAAFLIGYVTSIIQRRRDVTRHEPSFVAPSRVFDLDIRPESLPDDIGAAARRLWDRAEHRAALALLYRGLLSRLAHVHQVPIRDSSTEGDCLALAARHLPPVKSEYASRLVGAWQRAIYGCEDLQTDIVHRLCEGFSSTLDKPSPLGTAT